MTKKSPSNKKDGKSYLLSLEKKVLVDKIIATNIELDNVKQENEKLKKEMIDLKQKMNNIKIHGNEDILKKVLELRAKNYAPTIIHDKLRLQGVELSVKKIKDMINTELSPAMELFFSECKQAYVDAIKINTSGLKWSSIEEYQRLIDSAYEDLEEIDSDDAKLKDSIRNSISNYIAKRDVLIKNIDEVSEETEEDTLASDNTRVWEEHAENVIIDLSKIMGAKHG